MKKLLLLSCVILFCTFYASVCFPQSLWELANENKDILRISTWISAHHVSTEEGLNTAIDWCKKTGVTRVFLGAYDEGSKGELAEREILERARARFEAAGIEGAGLIVTKWIGKLSSHSSMASCYTSEETRKELQNIFEFTASIFDLIMIDDWFFTDCECEDCRKALGERRMSEYRCDLMVEVSREYILKPAKAVNPNVRVIIKYPLWYDDFHRRGYDVLRQTAQFDLIWAGNESRDYDFDVSPIGEVQYQSYFNMRWIGIIGGDKTGGGWFDALATTPKTYLEQARQTVLGDAKEMMLCSYGLLTRETNTWGGRPFQGTGIANVEALRRELPGLFELAKMVRNKPIKGILATKPANSDPYDNFEAIRGARKPDAHIYDFVGMLGLPLVPSTEIDTGADAAFFPFQVLKDPTFPEKLRKMLSEGKPVLITDKLAKRLDNIGKHDNLIVLPVKGDTPGLLKLSREELNAIRDKLLEPLGIKFDAPGKVGLYLMGDDIMVIENFNNEPVDVTIGTSFSMKAQVKLVLPQEESIRYDVTGNKLVFNMPPRTLVAINIGLGTPLSTAVAATGTRVAGGTQAADLQRGKTYASESAPGDRHPSINQVYPPEAFYHAGRSGRILDVTKPPFNAKGDGVTDDTKALIAALRFVRDNYEIHQGDGYSYCTKRHNRNWVVYLPDGEYLVSDTVSQGWPALAMNILKGWDHVEFFRVESPEHERELNGGHFIRGQSGKATVYAENNWYLRVIGQSRDKTIIRLKDNAPDFGVGAEKAVLTFYLLQVGSNVNLGNFCENLTIDTGRSNPGAVGLKWNSSNWGGVRNLSIRSGDGAGRAGLLSEANNATGYLRDLCIKGFDTGIEIAAGRETMVVLEYATLSGQRETAIRIGDARSGPGGDPLSARKLLVENAPVALRVGRAGQAIVLESEFRAASEQAVAMDVEPDGFLLARDVRIQGYRAAVRHRGKITAGAGNIAEYATAPVVALDDEPPLRLPVKDTPLILPETDIAQWANVDDFGAMGDGIADDTSAIQRAMDSGKPVIWFPRANYVINGTVDIPASVREITMLFGVIHRSKASGFDGPALFRVAEPSAEPLLIHQSMSAGCVLVDHAADRPLVIEDMFMEFNHTRSYSAKPGMNFPSEAAQDTEIWRLYRNTRPEGAPKEVFVNNSIGFSSDNEAGTLALENVRVWARMINTEHVPANYSFRRSDAWIFGFKSEAADTLLKATNGSRVEVLGGSFLLWYESRGPVIDSRDSAIAAVFLQWYWKPTPSTIFRNQQAGITTTLTKTRFESLDKVDATFIRVSSSNRRKPD